MDTPQEFQEMIDLSKGLHVLYVEDDSDLLGRTKELLSNIFEYVDTAVDGEQAMEAYKNKSYDLVITDIKMPKKDGRDFLHFMKEINQDQVVIVTSAYNDSQRLMELIEFGIDAFLLKPISSKTFFKTIFAQVKKIHSKKPSS